MEEEPKGGVCLTPERLYAYRLKWFAAGERSGTEKIAQMVEGPFLHSEAPVAKWAREVAAAIRDRALNTSTPGGTT